MSHYFENDKSLKSEINNINVNIFDKIYSFYTDNGVFSKRKFDYGTRVLLENLVINKKCGKILDLGCGYGTVGVILGDNYENINIDMVDINEKAVLLSLKNLKFNNIKNANAFVSDIYDSVDNRYDYIITNPPIRAGKEVVRRFLLDSYSHLTNDGELWFVMRKDHGVKSMIGELDKVFSCDVIKRDKGFYVIKCIKKN